MRPICALLLLGFTGSAIYAASITVGTANGENCIPFVCNMSGVTTGESIEYQQVYSSTAFPGTVSIRVLNFRTLSPLVWGIQGVRSWRATTRSFFRILRLPWTLFR